MSHEFPSEFSEQTPESREEKEIAAIPVLDRELMAMGTKSQEIKANFVDEKKSLPPDALIDFYHGINGGLEGALQVLESPERGVKQISGPCLSLYPVGQFWKPGDAGFHYSIPRKSIEFPDESNPEAVIRVGRDGTAWLEGIQALPITEFNGEIMRTERKEDVYEERVVDGITEEVPIGERAIELTNEEKEIAAKIVQKTAELKAASESGSNFSALQDK